MPPFWFSAAETDDYKVSSLHSRIYDELSEFASKRVFTFFSQGNKVSNSNSHRSFIIRYGIFS